MSDANGNGNANGNANGNGNGAARENFWKKAAYVTANDINAVALYRVVTTAMGVILLSLLGYIGQRVISNQDRVQTDVSHATDAVMAMREDIAGLRTSARKTDERADRMADRLNGMDRDLAQMQVRVDILMMGRR